MREGRKSFDWDTNKNVCVCNELFITKVNWKNCFSTFFFYFSKWSNDARQLAKAFSAQRGVAQ